MVKCERPYTFSICNILQIPELVCRNGLNNIEISDPIRRPIFRMLLPYAVTGARFKTNIKIRRPANYRLVFLH